MGGIMNNLNECDGKVQFISLSKANQSAKNLNTNNQKRISGYKCSSCGYYHVGHETKNRMKPIKRKFIIQHNHESSIHSVVENKYLTRLKLI